MRAPAIQYSGPKIDPSVPWEIGRHIQLIYQKLNNHTQAFGVQQETIEGLRAGSTTTNIFGGGGSSSVTPSSGFMGQGFINDQTGATGYATQASDNGIFLILNDASAVDVTLTTAAAPFYLFITNFGAGTVTLTPSTGTINGGSSLALLQNQSVYASCDSTNWDATDPAAPSSTNFADGEVPSGAVDGSNVTFILDNSPSPASSLHLFRNGLRQVSPDDYTISGDTITYANPPSLGDTHVADYRF